MNHRKLKRTHILLPEDLAREIDAIAGRRGRSAFLVEVARDAVRRRKLLAFLKNDELVWRDEDHPELRKGSANWVRRIRRESGQRNAKSRTRRAK